MGNNKGGGGVLAEQFGRIQRPNNSSEQFDEFRSAAELGGGGEGGLGNGSVGKCAV